MSQLTNFLYPLPDRRRTAGSLLRWWESRRLAYNAIVGVTGLFTIAAVQLSFLLPPVVRDDVTEFPPWQAVVVYAVLANICYSFGWLADVVITKLGKGRVLPPDGVLFRQGLIFSVGLTLLPVVLAGLFWVARVVMWVAG